MFGQVAGSHFQTHGSSDALRSLGLATAASAGSCISLPSSQHIYHPHGTARSSHATESNQVGSALRVNSRCKNTTTTYIWTFTSVDGRPGQHPRSLKSLFLSLVLALILQSIRKLGQFTNSLSVIELFSLHTRELGPLKMVFFCTHELAMSVCSLGSQYFSLC